MPRSALRRLLTGVGFLAMLIGIMVSMCGCAVNGRPMRFDPKSASGEIPVGRRWFIQAKSGAPFSCSFVEFDERGDFLDFQQHLDCEQRVRDLVAHEKVVLVLYCHGWKNNSQSGDVAHFNEFLAKLANSEEIVRRGLRVHGVYLGWRGNALRPYVDRISEGDSYCATTAVFGEPIIAPAFQRRSNWLLKLPENLSYWNRRRAAENKVSGLPMARAIFTYAGIAKGFGKKVDNRVIVIGHSFGALMLERSLGQAMTGLLTMRWWGEGRAEKSPSLPIDLILFVNSAAPAIYAKEMRDFLSAYRKGLIRSERPDPDVPVIVSLTSTADWATGVLHPIGNMTASFNPSLVRRYTNGIFQANDGTYPIHRSIRQSEFYTKTPGHHPYLLNHWIIKEEASLLPADTSATNLFAENLSTTNADPNLFFTSTARHPAAAWRLTTKRPGKPLDLDGLTPAMADSNYWIIGCGKELIRVHNDVWSTTTMEMYAGIFRAAESRRSTPAKVVIGENESPAR